MLDSHKYGIKIMTKCDRCTGEGDVLILLIQIGTSASYYCNSFIIHCIIYQLHKNTQFNEIPFICSNKNSIQHNCYWIELTFGTLTCSIWIFYLLPYTGVFVLSLKRTDPLAWRFLSQPTTGCTFSILMV